MYRTHQPDYSELYPYLGDLHVHSSVSDGLLPPQDVALAAASRSLDFIAITDHNTPLGGVQGSRFAARLGEAAPTVLVAQELHFDRHVHIVLVSLAEQVSPPILGHFKLQALPRLSDRAHKAGGAVIVAHPWAFAGDRTAEDWTTSMIEEGHVDGAEVVSTTVDDGKFKDWSRTLRVYARRWRPLGVAAVGSTDWHNRSRGVAIGLARTYLMARDPSPRELAAALRAGDSVASLAATALTELGACRKLVQDMNAALAECGLPVSETDYLLSSKAQPLGALARAKEQAARALGLTGPAAAGRNVPAQVPSQARGPTMVHYCLGNYRRVLDAVRPGGLAYRGAADGGARVQR